MLRKQRSRPHGIRRESELVKWTRTPLYIHVEKDFQSHHMQIYSSTLMGGQERERKCVRNAKRSVSFSIFPPPDRLCTHEALYADEGGCTLSVGPRSQIGNPGFICSDGRSAGSGHVDFRIKEGQTVCR